MVVSPLLCFFAMQKNINPQTSIAPGATAEPALHEVASDPRSLPAASAESIKALIIIIFLDNNKHLRHHGIMEIQKTEPFNTVYYSTATVPRTW